MASFIVFLLCAKNYIRCFANTSNPHRSLKVLFISASRYPHLCPSHWPAQCHCSVSRMTPVPGVTYSTCTFESGREFLSSPNQRWRKWVTYTFDIYLLSAYCGPKSTYLGEKKPLWSSLLSMLLMYLGADWKGNIPRLPSYCNEHCPLSITHLQARLPVLGNEMWYS